MTIRINHFYLTAHNSKEIERKFFYNGIFCKWKSSLKAVFQFSARSGISLCFFTVKPSDSLIISLPILSQHLLATSCGSFKHGPSGEIESPNFPSSYDNDLYCTWKITVPTGKKVRIEFSEFKTEAGKDILYVFDTDKTEPILEFSGVGYKPRELTSSGKSLRIRFVSNGATASNGFRLTYSQVGKFCFH